MKTKILLGMGIGACALAWAAKDPVIMTVNGVDVPKSEFEYLYHKNSQQQLAPQPIGEYAEMFKNYRLKVADALAQGLDTTASFRQEMAQYRHDLAAPYLADSVYLNKLVKEAYNRSKDEVESSHIMIFKDRDPKVNAKSQATLDSLRAAIIAGADFTQLAAQYSQDRGSNTRGGSLGWITSGRLPYKYEETAFSLKPGEISHVIESPMAYHILKGGAHRPARGQVRVSHIMKMIPPTATEEEQARAQAQIDSIYDVVAANPALFEQMAVQYSEDPGSARQGGLLPWFGAGQMVEEFDSVSFALPIEAISKPFRSRFGWHIVKKLDTKGVPSLQEMKPGELQRIGNPQDERYQMVRDHQTAVLAKRHKALLDTKALDEMKLGLVMNGLDSAWYEAYSSPAARSKAIGTIGKTPLTTGEFIDGFFGAIQPEPSVAEKIFDNNVELFFNKKLTEAEEARLEADVPEYRNLLHEYENGSLLYEASVQRVWDRAAKDEEGLKQYFEEHRGDYGWMEPRAKGILVQAKNDSVANAVALRYAELPKDEALQTIRKEFKGEMSAEKVLLPESQNAMVDNLMFGAPETKPQNSAYTVYFMLDGRILNAPEEVADVRGQVTGDYQELLEKEWIADMRAKYPIVVYDKVLKSVK